MNFKSFKDNCNILKYLAYKDDMELLTRTVQAFSCVFTELKKEAQLAGLEMNRGNETCLLHLHKTEFRYCVYRTNTSFN